MRSENQSHDPGITLRRARPDDQPTIRQMVRGARLDPTNIRWANFIVAERGGEIAGIGQVRPYRTCRELGSLVVREPHRRQGIAAQIVRELVAGEVGEVYLECASHMPPYYTRFGFEIIPWQRAPMPLRFKVGLVNLVGRLLGHRVVVMRLHATGDTPHVLSE